MTESPEPLPCPFCGESVEVAEYNGNYTRPPDYCVHCERCDLSLDGDPTPETAIARWNTRTPDPAAIHAKAIAQAAAFVARRRDDYVSEHGIYDSSTGVTEFPGNGDETVGEWEEIEEGIRALSPDSGLVVVRREQVEAWINEIDRWGKYSEYKGHGRMDEDDMIAEMRALLSQPAGGGNG